MRAIRTQRFKYIRNFELRPDFPPLSGPSFKGERVPAELYDLEADPTEMNNLVGKSEFAEIERDLDARLTRWMEETDDPILKGPVPAPPGARLGAKPS
jgi:arylsulfatase A-like enzyme